MAFKLGNPGDGISSMLGAPPNTWKESEKKQMKEIHRCFQAAQKTHRASFTDEDDDLGAKTKRKGVIPFGHMADSNIDLVQVGQKEIQFESVLKAQEAAAAAASEEKDDEVDPGHDAEFYLLQSSPLRSNNNEMKAPKNPVAKDHEKFLQTLEFSYWSDHFNGQQKDANLSQLAASIVNSICTMQVNGIVRVRKGVIPGRKRREHITPLALFFHELKLWCVNWLRIADPYQEATHMEIKHRMKYLDLVLRKDVWGNANNRALFLGSGIHAEAHKEMVRVQVIFGNTLKSAYEHSLRQFNSQSSREKLHLAREAMKTTLYEHMTVLSGLMSFNTPVGKAKLIGVSLLQSLNTQGGTDFSNLVNVCLYGLLKNELVRGPMESKYSVSMSEIGSKFSNWAEENLFCTPSDEEGEPFFKFATAAGESLIPGMYTPIMEELKVGLKKADPNRKGKLIKAKEQQATLQKWLGFDKAEKNKPVETVMKSLMKSLAAFQDLIPTLFLVDYFHELSGSVGDFTLYDTLREYVIDSMVKSVEKLQILQDTTKQLLKVLKKLTKKLGDKMKTEAQQKGKKMVSTPDWCMNVDIVAGDSFKQFNTNAKTTTKLLVSICHDAWYYDLTSDDINDKIENAKKTVGFVFNKEEEEAPAEVVLDKTPRSKEELTTHIKANKKEGWLKEDTPPEEYEFGTGGAFGEAEGNTNPFNFEEDDVPAKNNAYNYDSDNSSI